MALSHEEKLNCFNSLDREFVERLSLEELCAFSEKCKQLKRWADVTLKAAASNRYFSPQKESRENMLKLLEDLNDGQRAFVMHIYKCFITETNPEMKIFLSGSAGVGKSRVIHTLYQLLTHHFDKQSTRENTIKVLLTAFAGMAAFLINGTTLHTAFSIPPKGKSLSKRAIETLCIELRDLKLLIIDEVSMVGCKLLRKVSTRLGQIMGNQKEFGGIPVLVVGDLNQLPPVFDTPMFEWKEMWDTLQCFELTEIIRQKDDKDLVKALNNLAVGTMSEEDIQLIKNRQVHDSAVPIEAVRLFYENKDVDKHNEDRINTHEGEIVEVKASDNITGAEFSDAAKESILKKSVTQSSGLPGYLKLKIGIKYMITRNINLSDGLVNGATGLLKYIKFDESYVNERIPEIIFIEFATANIGVSTRQQNPQLYTNDENIDKNWVPIKKMTKLLEPDRVAEPAYKISRTQFPLTPAEAVTIHKSQGQTYESVCLHLPSSKALQRQLLYVALSRVTKLSRLYIVGEFKPPNEPKPGDKLMNAINELKTEKKLELSFNEMKNETGTIIAYHKIKSYADYQNHIKNDAWFSKCDILIFSHTQAISKDVFNLRNYEAKVHIDRKSDDRVPGPGFVILVKNSFQCFFKHLKQDVISLRRTGSLDLILVQIGEDVFLITGFRSKKYSKEKTLEKIKMLSNTAKQRNGNARIILMGDFNMHADELEGFYLNATNKVKSEIGPSENNKSSVLLANFDELISGTYCSYFSDHLPRFCTFEMDKRQITDIKNLKLVD